MIIPYYPPDSPELTTNVPTKLKGATGKDNFESLLLQGAVRMKERVHMGRYGVTAIRRSATDIMCIPSKPDFCGVHKGGSAFDIEAKVESGASFSLGKESFKDSQYAWLCVRALYGVEAYLVIHYNARKGKTFDEPAFTVRLLVHPDLPMWKEYEANTLKRIPRDMALARGEIIPWTISKGSKKPLPHFI